MDYEITCYIKWKIIQTPTDSMTRSVLCGAVKGGCV